MRLVTSAGIGSWLAMAAQLELVKVDFWKFDDGLGSMYCEPVADRNDSDSKHYSKYATDLTKFTFVLNALEEAYRFAAASYDRSSDHPRRGRAPPIRQASMKAAAIVDRFPLSMFPEHFEHVGAGFKFLSNQYLQLRKSEPPSAGGLEAAPSPCESLALLRKLRNEVAHGLFLIAENEEYDWPSGGSVVVRRLLNKGCRLAALFIQAILGGLSYSFTSDDYDLLANYDEPVASNFRKHCGPTYFKTLHLDQDFTIVQAMNHGLI